MKEAVKVIPIAIRRLKREESRGGGGRSFSA
jgi:hypothetical protein